MRFGIQLIMINFNIRTKERKILKYLTVNLMKLRC